MAEPKERTRHGRFWLGTLSARVIALSAAMTVAILGIAFALTYLPAQNILEEETSQVVDAELRGLIDNFEEGGIEVLQSAIGGRSQRGGDAIYMLETASGEPLAGQRAKWPANVPLDRRWTRFRFEEEGEPVVEAGGRALPLYEAGTPQGVQAYRLLVARDFGAQRKFSVTLAESALLALLAAGALAIGGGYVINRLVMRRIGDIDATARGIMAGDLTRRIPARRESDEFSRLSTTLNAMLEKIEILVVELRAVTDSLAHDLRTPLTRLQTQISRAADGELSGTAHREALVQAQVEADRMLAAFTAMIDLARAETGVAREQFTDFDLGAVVRDVCEFHEPLAEQLGVKLAVDARVPAPVKGHAQLLAQLTSNLLDNALKHGAAGGEIAVRVWVEHGLCVLTVADRGPGIPAEARASALKRFGRLDDARSTPGSGLGLSLAETIARMHAGALKLEDNAPGLRVRVEMPVRGVGG
jgi:signal transduction histidine kinase